MKLILLFLLLGVTAHAQYSVTATRYAPANDVTLYQIRFDCGKREKIAVFMCQGNHLSDTAYVINHSCVLNKLTGVNAFPLTEWNYVAKKDELQLKEAVGLERLCNLNQ